MSDKNLRHSQQIWLSSLTQRKYIITFTSCGITIVVKFIFLYFNSFIIESLINFLHIHNQLHYIYYTRTTNCVLFSLDVYTCWICLKDGVALCCNILHSVGCSTYIWSSINCKYCCYFLGECTSPLINCNTKCRYNHNISITICQISQWKFFWRL